jgi:hypothetical protein
MLWPSSIQACTDHGLVVSEAMPHADVGHPSEARPTSVFGQRSHPQAGLLSNSVAASLSSNSLLAYFSIGEKLSMAGENPGVPYRVICSGEPPNLGDMQEPSAHNARFFLANAPGGHDFERRLVALVFLA